MGEARVSMPGGCSIGTRPVDFHLDALKALGAAIDIEEGYVLARAKQGLRGARIRFEKNSVGATHTALLTAALARGESVIENAAQEPEIGDVAACLQKMGAKIEGAGTATIRVQGVERLHAAPRGAARPDRDRNLCHGDGDDRRRRDAARRAHRVARGAAAVAGECRGRDHQDQRGHPH